MHSFQAVVEDLVVQEALVHQVEVGDLVVEEEEEQGMEEVEVQEVLEEEEVEADQKRWWECHQID